MKALSLYFLHSIYVGTVMHKYRNDDNSSNDNHHHDHHHLLYCYYLYLIDNNFLMLPIPSNNVREQLPHFSK